MEDFELRTLEVFYGNNYGKTPTPHKIVKLDHTRYTWAYKDNSELVALYKVDKDYLYFVNNGPGFCLASQFRNKFKLKDQYRPYNQNEVKFGDKFIFKSANRLNVVCKVDADFVYVLPDGSPLNSSWLCYTWREFHTFFSNEDGSPAGVKV